MSRFSAYCQSAGASLSRLTPASLILAYHRVAPEDGPDPWELRVDPERFEAHLQVLQSLDCRPLAHLFDPPTSRRTVAITFDDGYADNLLWAAPALQRYGLPATFFLVSGPGTDFWWDRLASLGRLEQYQELQAMPPQERDECLVQLGSSGVYGPKRLTTEQIQELAGMTGFEIGAHTVSHARLGGLEGSEALEELLGSRLALSELVGRPVNSLSYPFGSPPRDLHLVERAGFARACTVRADLAWRHDSPWDLPRLTVKNWSGAEFEEFLHRGMG